MPACPLPTTPLNLTETSGPAPAPLGTPYFLPAAVGSAATAGARVLASTARFSMADWTLGKFSSPHADAEKPPSGAATVELAPTTLVSRAIATSRTTRRPAQTNRRVRGLRPSRRDAVDVTVMT